MNFVFPRFVFLSVCYHFELHFWKHIWQVYLPTVPERTTFKKKKNLPLQISKFPVLSSCCNHFYVNLFTYLSGVCIYNLYPAYLPNDFKIDLKVMYNTIKIEILQTHMSVCGGEILSEKVYMSKILVVYIKFSFISG